MENQPKLENVTPTNGQQTILIQNTNPNLNNHNNPLGTAGFVLSLIGLFLGWIPFLGWVIWVLGAIFSGVGMAKRPRGLAIAGLSISLGSLVIILVILAAMGFLN